MIRATRLSLQRLTAVTTLPLSLSLFALGFSQFPSVVDDLLAMCGLVRSNAAASEQHRVLRAQQREALALLARSEAAREAAEKLSESLRPLSSRGPLASGARHQVTAYLWALNVACAVALLSCGAVGAVLRSPVERKLLFVLAVPTAVLRFGLFVASARRPLLELVCLCLCAFLSGFCAHILSTTR
jgi:hypothetical protein